MKLKTYEIISFFQALTALRGAPTIIMDQERGGGRVVVYEPYPMGHKAKWNAAKNREILMRLVNAHDEVVQDEKASLNAFRKVQMRSFLKEEDPAVRKQMEEEAVRNIQDRVDECNERLRKIAKDEQEVNGLLKIPARGLCLKTSLIPPNVISDLMPLIDGEPDFESDKDSRPPPSN